MRINKYLASAGVASRRRADEMITEGRVRINGAVLREPGYDVQDGDLVLVDGKPVAPTGDLVYYLLNKPEGYITTTSDEQGRPTVTELLEEIPQRLFPVGRLDAATTGLLIMTNDGELSYHLSHPSQKVWKTYVARIDGPISNRELSALEKGVDIDGYITRPAKARLIKETASGCSVVELKISEGKNRQVRRMFKALGFNVLELERRAIGNVQLGHTRKGSYRKLSKEEVDYLKNC